MNESIIIEQIGTAIQTRTFALGKMYHLCLWEDKIQCMACNHTDKEHLIFGRYANRTLDAGFTSRQWDSMAKRILNQLTQEKICLPLPKH